MVDIDYQFRWSNGEWRVLDSPLHREYATAKTPRAPPLQEPVRMVVITDEVMRK